MVDFAVAVNWIEVLRPLVRDAQALGHDARFRHQANWLEVQRPLARLRKGPDLPRRRERKGNDDAAEPRQDD